MKVYLVSLSVFGEEKLNAVTAKDEKHADEMTRDFWDDKSLEIHKISEISKCEVFLTKHI